MTKSFLANHSCELSPEEAEELSPNFGGKTGTIGKALTVLRCFVDRQEMWGVRELAAMLNQPQSSVHRILKMLTVEGLLEFDKPLQKYRIGTEFFRVAAIVNQRLEITKVAKPLMERLTDEVGETCVLSLVDFESRRVVHIAARECNNPLRLVPPIGEYSAMTNSASGLAALASLPQSHFTNVLDVVDQSGELSSRLDVIALDGYATDTLKEGSQATAIASAVLNADGIPIATLSTLVPHYRLSTSDLLSIGASVRRYARDLSRNMGAKLLGGSPTSGWHAGMNALAGILHDRSSEFSVTAGPGGGRQNLEDVHSGRGAYCLTTLSSLVHAHQGSAPFKTPLNNLRAIMNVSNMDLHIVTHRDLPIRSVRDIFAFRISPGQDTMSTSETFEELKQHLNITTADIAEAGGEVVHLEFLEAKRQFIQRQVDVLIWFTSRPSQMLDGLDPTAVRMIGLDDGSCGRMVQACPAYSKVMIPKHCYPWLAEDLDSLGVPTTIVTNVNRSEDEVYEVTRAIHEQRDNLKLLSTAFTSLNYEFLNDAAWIPIHPGAKRFWDEMEILRNLTIT